MLAAMEPRVGAAAAVVEGAPNWKVLPVAGAVAAVVAVLVAGAALQLPKRDLTDGWVAGSVEGAEAGVPAVLLDKPVNNEEAGTAALLLVSLVNTEDALAAVEGAEVAAAAAGCPKAMLAVALPKMGLKVGAAGLLSGAEAAGAVAVAPKMGLNKEVRRGLVLLAVSVVVAEVVVGTMEEVE